MVEDACHALPEPLRPVAADDAFEGGGAGAHADNAGVDVAGDHLRHP